MAWIRALVREPDVTDGARSIEQRLAALEARQEVLDALRAYSHAIDLGDREAWLDCFVPEGVFDVRSRLREYPRRRFVGREQLRTFIEGHSAPPEAHHKHLYLVEDIHLDGDTASASAYFVHLVDREGRPFMTSYGRYLDSLRLCEDRRWRIVKRIAEVEASDASVRASGR